MPSNAASFLDIARAELGAHEEPPGSNLTKFGAEYGMNPAQWCAEFACSWVWRRAGLPIPKDAQGPNGWASVGFFLQSARNNGWVVNEPSPGDLVLFAWTPADISWPDHVGIVEDLYADGSIATIEGNASGPDGVGDEVARHIRPHDSTIVAFIAPPFGSSVSPPTSYGPVPSSPEARSLVNPGYPRLSNGVLLEQGSGHHDQVGIYQDHMAKRGWSIGVDGLFGPETYRVTTQFQTEKGLAVDGVVGQETWGGAFTLPTT